MHKPTLILLAAVLGVAGCADDDSHDDAPPTSDVAAPAAPTALRQQEPGGADIASGGVTASNVVTFTAAVSDPDGGSVALEVEVRPEDQPFTGVPNTVGGYVPSGVVASASMGALDDGTAYRWQARAVDSAGHTSGWVEYSPTPISAYGQYFVAAFLYASLALQAQCAASAPESSASPAWLAAAALLVAIGLATAADRR